MAQDNGWEPVPTQQTSANGWEDVSAPTPSAPPSTNGATLNAPPVGKGFTRSLEDASGVSLLTHPIDTLTGVVNEAGRVGSQLKTAWNGPPSQAIDNTMYAIPFLGGALKEADENYRAGIESLRKEGLTENTRRLLGASIPILGQVLQQAQAQHDQGDTAGALGTLIGTALGGGIAEKIPEVAGKAKSTIADRVYPQATTLSTPEIAARGVAKALSVPETSSKNFIEAATHELPHVMDYAKRNGMEVNATVDFAKAAKGAAKELQTHFDDKFIKPYAKDTLSVPPDYRGIRLNTEGKNTATIGDINNRINTINQELSPNFRKKAAFQTNAAQVSDAELLAEKGKLTDLLRKSLSERTGVSPDEIGTLYQKAGRLRDIAEDADVSDRSNLTKSGPSTPSGHDFSKKGAINRAVEHVLGDSEIAGNRAIKAALKDIQPVSYAPPEPIAQVPKVPAALPIREDLLQKITTKQPLTEADYAELRKTPAGRKAILDSIRGKRTESVPTPSSAPITVAPEEKLASRNKEKAAKAANDAALAARNKAMAEQEFLHAQNLEEMAQQEAARRGITAEQARALIRGKLYNWRTGK